MKTHKTLEITTSFLCFFNIELVLEDISSIFGLTRTEKVTGNFITQLYYS